MQPNVRGASPGSFGWRNVRFAAERAKGPPWAVIPSKTTSSTVLSVQLVLELAAEPELLSAAIRCCLSLSTAIDRYPPR